MIQQRTSQPHPAVTAVSAHFARLGNPRVDGLPGRAVRCAREHPDAHGGEGERIDSLLDKRAGGSARDRTEHS